jgi:hypothetical protein
LGAGAAAAVAGPAASGRGGLRTWALEQAASCVGLLRFAEQHANTTGSARCAVVVFVIWRRDFIRIRLTVVFLGSVLVLAPGPGPYQQQRALVLTPTRGAVI